MLLCYYVIMLLLATISKVMTHLSKGLQQEETQFGREFSLYCIASMTLLQRWALPLFYTFRADNTVTK